MKILSVCNVTQITGGTLQAAHSMIRALPDCQHRLHSFGGAFGNEAQQFFGEGVELVRGHNVIDSARDFEPDVIIYHNTSAERIPNSPPHGALQVYYQHSAAKAATQGREKCQIVLCVSRHLAKVVGLPESAVLYQPVTTPAVIAETTKTNYLRIGRLCTPNRAKWNKEDWLPYYEAALAYDRTAQFEFVGCPDYQQRDVSDALGGNVRFYPASVTARSLLHEWDILLYTSSIEESFGRVVREAQACGCVPVVSRRGGFIEQVDPDCGYLVDRPEDVASVIGHYLVNREDIIGRCVRRGKEEGSLAVWRTRFLERVTKG